jgi:hypothetical protein
MGAGAIVDKRLNNMLKELGDAISNSLSDSDQIAEVISRIKAGGYDVFVVLEATIGLNQCDEDAAQTTSVNRSHNRADFEMTSQDVKFLKSLRIRLDDAG